MRPLLDRDADLRALTSALQRAAGGEGVIRVVTGVAGIGKTSLLAAAVAHSPIRVLRARPGEFERDLPFEVVRELLTPALLTLDEAARHALLRGPATFAAPVLGLPAEGAAAADPSAALNGLYWVVEALAARAPVALVVDDAQWADELSLRFFGLVARRIEGLALALVLGVRSGAAAGSTGDLLAEVAAQPSAARIALAPLTDAAVVQLLSHELGDGSDAAGLAPACSDATGGNPFLVVELAGAIRERQAAAGKVDADIVAALVPDDLGEHVRRRLAQLPRGAVAIAEALAVLGREPSPRAAAQLAGVGQDDLADVAEHLAAAGILAPGLPLEFAHPLLRAAVADGIGAIRTATLHRRAAAVLEALGADAERIAAHLASVPPAGDPWVVGCLRGAAERALARGAPAAAAGYLARALDEPPPAEERGTVVHALGTAESRAGVGGIDHLCEAAALAPDREARLRIAAELAMLPFVSDPTVNDLVAEAAREAGEHDRLRPLLVANVALRTPIGLHRPVPDDVAGALEQLAGPDTQATRYASAVLAYLRVLGNAGAASAVAAAVDSVADERAHAADTAAGHPMLIGLQAMIYADELEPTAARVDEVVASARRRGSLPATILGLTNRGWLLLRQGDLRGALADAELATELASGTPMARIALAPRVCALVLRDELAEVRELVAAADVVPLRQGLEHVYELAAAEADLAAGVPRRAVERARAVEGWANATGLDSAAAMPWREVAARAELALGRRDVACELALAHLERAERWGAPTVVGVARRTAALTGPDAGRLAGVERALSAFGEGGAPLERAATLIELGAERRRRNDRRAAREPLAEALDVADRCGARALVERAREELLASGAKPRRDRRWGVDALTTSELRVARLAAQGLTNREIAQALFVTPKTVETHLGRCYRKLGVAGRGELETGLDG